jgi:hypothetical protein
MADLTINQQPLPEFDPNNQSVNGGQEITNLKKLQVGTGDVVFLVDREAVKSGGMTSATANIVLNYNGTATFKTPTGTTILNTAATDGNYINIINTALNSATKTILTDFTFQSTDYAGAFKAGNPTWDQTTGLITGGSGVLINARGILGASAGSPTFTLDATTGNASFKGSISASTITGGTVTGATVTARSGTSGTNISLDSSAGAAIFSYNNTAIGSIASDSTASMLYSSNVSHLFFSGGNTVATLNTDGLTLNGGENLFLQNAQAIHWSSGREIYDDADDIGCNGTFRPKTDGGSDLGKTNRRWNGIHANDIKAYSNFISSDGSNGKTITMDVVSYSYFRGGSVLVNGFRTLTFKNGLLTAATNVVEYDV